jgi:hypothetical protein
MKIGKKNKTANEEISWQKNFLFGPSNEAANKRKIKQLNSQEYKNKLHEMTKQTIKK